jgi:protein arginine kinase
LEKTAVLYAEAMLRRNYQDLQFCPQNYSADLAESKRRSVTQAMQMNPDFRIYHSGQQALSFPESLRNRAFDRLSEAVFLEDERNGWYIAVNAEEHLLIMTRGEEAEVPLLIDTLYLLEKRMLLAAYPFAYDDRYGYLSFKPSLAGTGLHVQFLLHLPMLSYLKQIRSLNDSFKKLECALKPMGLSENRNPGRLYLLSNTHSRNKNIQQIAECVHSVLETLVKKEQALQQRTLNKHNSFSGTLDQVWRSYGILRYARRLTTTDFLAHWSNLRLGAGMKILPLVTIQADQLLSFAGEQAFVMMETDPRTYPFRRADEVRRMLSGGK